MDSKAIMKYDLKEATFIIPIRIESSDRLRNVITTTAYLLENFDTNIIIKEVDSESIFENEALPILKDILDVNVNVNHIFEKSDEPLFHRQKVLNEMIMEADTKIVINYDCDVLLPLDSYDEAYQSILHHTHDVIYPYGQGMYQYQVRATDEIVLIFYKLEILTILRNILIFIRQILDGSSFLIVRFILMGEWRMRILRHMLQKTKKDFTDLLHWDII